MRISKVSQRQRHRVRERILGRLAADITPSSAVQTGLEQKQTMLLPSLRSQGHCERMPLTRTLALACSFLSSLSMLPLSLATGRMGTARTAAQHKGFRLPRTALNGVPFDVVKGRQEQDAFSLVAVNHRTCKQHCKDKTGGALTCGSGFCVHAAYFGHDPYPPCELPAVCIAHKLVYNCQGKAFGIVFKAESSNQRHQISVEIKLEILINIDKAPPPFLIFSEYSKRPYNAIQNLLTCISFVVRDLRRTVLLIWCRAKSTLRLKDAHKKKRIGPLDFNRPTSVTDSLSYIFDRLVGPFAAR